jgi:hypothetical protein
MLTLVKRGNAPTDKRGKISLFNTKYNKEYIIFYYILLYSILIYMYSASKIKSKKK